MLALSSRSACLVWLGIAAVGCVSSGLGPGVELIWKPDAGAFEPALLEIQRAADSASGVRPALIVGNQKQLELWLADGSAHYSLSAGAALHPRRVASDAVVVLSAESGGLQQGAELVRISLRDGSRAVVAELPAFACANAASKASDALDLDIQDPSDFALDAQGNVACLTFMDRNANMANLQLQLRVELGSGRVQRWLTVGAEECKAPSGVESEEPELTQSCELPAEHDAEPAATYPFDFDEDTGWVKRLGKRPARLARLPEFTRELVSPSGRWLVLGGNLTEGDYMHRNLVLCDRQDGALYPVIEQPGAWPAPLRAAKRNRTIDVPGTGMADVVGESDVRWLSLSAASELLVVDQLVIRPKQASWAFEGELTR